MQNTLEKKMKTDENDREYIGIFCCFAHFNDTNMAVVHKFIF